VIVGFGDKGTRDVYDGTDSKDTRSTIPKPLWKVARRKLDMLHGAYELKDLAAAQLEKLRANWAGFWSIRVNDQYRVVFSFANGNADEVRIVDYH
jgi:toxin HigB-1